MKMQTADPEAFIQVKPVCVVPVYARVERHAIVSAFLRECKDVLQQYSRVSLAAVRFQRAEVVDIDLFSIVQFPDIPESDGRSSDAVSLDKGQFVTFRLHFSDLLHKAGLYQMWS